MGAVLHRQEGEKIYDRDAKFNRPRKTPDPLPDIVAGWNLFCLFQNEFRDAIDTQDDVRSVVHYQVIDYLSGVLAPGAYAYPLG
ncbi:Uncharacterised protein [uncultured archaeon]|nr:Uncharacterised protein [uncultured archaeon]